MAQSGSGITEEVKSTQESTDLNTKRIENLLRNILDELQEVNKNLKKIYNPE